jgi:hypothetical protein
MRMFSMRFWRFIGEFERSESLRASMEKQGPVRKVLGPGVHPMVLLL